MKRLILFAFALLLLPCVAHAHAMLDHADPKVGSTGPAPRQITLWFTQDLEPKFSRIEVRSGGGERVDGGKAQVSHTSMTTSLKALPAGIYTVNWSVLSVDTHKTQGSFSFTVAK